MIVVVLPCCAARFEIHGGRAANLQYAPQMFLVLRHNRTVEAKIKFYSVFVLRRRAEENVPSPSAPDLLFGPWNQQQVVTPLKVSSPKRRDDTAGD